MPSSGWPVFSNKHNISYIIYVTFFRFKEFCAFELKLQPVTDPEILERGSHNVWGEGGGLGRWSHQHVDQGGG